MKLLAALAATTALAMPLAAHAAGYDGPYVGANVGYALGDVTIDDQDCWASCSSQTFSPNGITIGGVVGFNHQMGSTVIGIEGDYNWMNGDEHKITNWPSEHRAKIKSYGSVRARAGLTVDKTLVYATAGLGIIDQEAFAADQNSTHTVNTHGFSDHSTRVGLAAGAGAEFAVSDNVRLKLEYLYVGTPAKQNIHDQFATSGTCFTAPDTYCNFGYTTHINVIRAGAVWAF
jgi:outer membrane immunogenic protein